MNAPTSETAAVRRHGKLSLLVVSLALPFVFAAACDRSERPAAPAQLGGTRIVVIGEGKDDIAWPVIEATGAWFMQRMRGVDVRVIAPETSSPRAQQELLRGLVDDPTTAVCICPTDPKAVRELIDEVARKGKPVVTFWKDVRDSNRAAYFGPAESEVGGEAALACPTSRRGSSTAVILLRARPEDESYQDRTYAFEKTLKSSQLDLMRAVECDGSPSAALRLLRTESELYPRVGCWVFLDDWPLRGLAVNEKLPPIDAGIVVCNGSARYFPRLRNGELAALIGFDRRECLEQALFAALSAVRNPNLPISGYTAESVTITARNLDHHAEQWANWRRVTSE